jgi:hypothetical protein
MRKVPVLNGYLNSTEVMAKLGLSDRLALLGLEQAGLIAGHRPNGEGRGKPVYYSLAAVSAVEAGRAAVAQALVDFQNAEEDAFAAETGNDTVTAVDETDATGAEFGDVVTV